MWRHSNFKLHKILEHSVCGSIENHFHSTKQNSWKTFLIFIYFTHSIDCPCVCVSVCVVVLTAEVVKCTAHPIPNAQFAIPLSNFKSTIYSYVCHDMHNAYAPCAWHSRSARSSFPPNSNIDSNSKHSATDQSTLFRRLTQMRSLPEHEQIKESASSRKLNRLEWNRRLAWNAAWLEIVEDFEL